MFLYAFLKGFESVLRMKFIKIKREMEMEKELGKYVL